MRFGGQNKIRTVPQQHPPALLWRVSGRQQVLPGPGASQPTFIQHITEVTVAEARLRSSVRRHLQHAFEQRKVQAARAVGIRGPRTPRALPRRAGALIQAAGQDWDTQAAPPDGACRSPNCASQK